jgi:outer membrane protein, multidrug efflux system
MTRAIQVKTAAVVLLTTMLSGCLVGPNYKRPPVNAPVAFRGAEGAAQQASLADLPWWDVFKDDILKTLVQTALTNNYDLKIAVTRIEQSRQIAAQVRSQFYPSVSYNGALSGGKNEFLGTVAPNGGTTQGAFWGAASAAWEIDVWGRIRRQSEAANAQYLASEEGKRAVMLSLVSSVSQAYFELLGLQLQLEIAKEATKNFGETLTLFTQRLQGGVASKLQTSAAAADEATAAAQIPQIELQIALTENQISVLLGENPTGIATRTKLLDEVVPPDIPSGLPSALLERRPDILSAEQQVAAANAQVGVAIANYFPQIGLTTFFGQGTAPLQDLASGKATTWSAAASLAGPLYRGGALKAAKLQAIAFWEESKLQYQLSALNAFQDVSNALISRTKYDAIRTDQQRAVVNYQEAVRIALLRYNAGKASYYEVLQQQQLLFPAETALAVTETSRRTVIVQLYKALGGGWNLTDPQWMGNQPPVAPTTPPKP